MHASSPSHSPPERGCRAVQRCPALSPQRSSQALRDQPRPLRYGSHIRERLSRLDAHGSASSCGRPKIKIRKTADGTHLHPEVDLVAHPAAGGRRRASARQILRWALTLGDLGRGSSGRRIRLGSGVVLPQAGSRVWPCRGAVPAASTGPGSGLSALRRTGPDEQAAAPPRVSPRGRWGQPVAAARNRQPGRQLRRQPSQPKWASQATTGVDP